MTKTIAIIGLDQVGASFGLALAANSKDFYRVGYDRDGKTGQQAVKDRAIDKSALNLPGAVEKADFVVLAVPAFEVKIALEVIAPVLKEGAIVVDTSPLKQPSTETAANAFPAGRWFVSISPTLNPLSFANPKPSAELFKNSLAELTAGKGTPEAVVDAVIEMVELLGAKVQFSDALEHDGLAASARQLPEITAAALFHAVADQPGWQESRKLAGSAFANTTSPLTAFTAQESPAEGLLQNQANALRVLDNFIAALNELREDLASNRQKEINEFFTKAASGRQLWQQQRQSAEWEMHLETPQRPDLVSRLFGSGARTRKK